MIYRRLSDQGKAGEKSRYCKANGGELGREMEEEVVIVFQLIRSPPEAHHDFKKVLEGAQLAWISI